MKKVKSLTIKLSEDIAKKLAYVCDKEGISIQNQLNSMIRQKIAYFERVKGNIKPNMLESVDLSELSAEENEDK